MEDKRPHVPFERHKEVSESLTKADSFIRGLEAKNRLQSCKSAVWNGDGMFA